MNNINKILKITNFGDPDSMIITLAGHPIGGVREVNYTVTANKPTIRIELIFELPAEFVDITN